jgi:hypothetical protein
LEDRTTTRSSKNNRIHRLYNRYHYCTIDTTIVQSLSVQRAQEKEMQLETITKQQDINSQTCLELVNTNRKTVDELKVHTTQFLMFLHLSSFIVFLSQVTDFAISLSQKSTKITVQDDITQTLVTACIGTDFDQSGHYPVFRSRNTNIRITIAKYTTE